jgi:EAL domain-containing protein (putative c-di-GMP-specific phosphodiesterase class I)
VPAGPRSLNHALGPGRLEPHFQAVIECSTGMLRAVEALARWRTGDDLIEGEDLVALAAQFDACALLDAEMLRLAVEQVAAWRRLPGLRTLELHANLSPQSLRVPGLAARIERTCREAGLNPAALWMEVTETSVIGDLPQAATTLSDLRTQGVRIWVDDFGAGYASLAYVKQLPIDGVKIDRSFIADIESSETGRAIVAAVVSLASPLALGVIAEGVESERQADVVRTLGVHATQGFYHGRPQSPSDGIGGLEGSPRRANPLPVAAAGSVAAHRPPAGSHTYRHRGTTTALATIREEERLRVVAACSPPLGEYDPVLHEVVRFVADVCEVEVAVIGVDDRDRTHCLAQHGATSGGHRECSAAARLTPVAEVSVIPDLGAEERFAAEPLVREDGMRFLAAHALSVDGQRVGSLVLLGTRPRRPTRRQLRFLHQAAERVQAHLQLRCVRARLRDAEVALALART